MSLAVKPLAAPPFPLWHLEKELSKEEKEGGLMQ